ncbi:hypothetical protein [Raineyella sp. LH-20]|uniref:hypothetical protein n=1 Tax=Raineyella sp. LH-20 TaxID=3081204 RepID=UPI0029539442|nr:hypothetical protein [Raineyella sp. LH-20]WOP17507.1 hypothetical protein R0146_09475 [Raineyella sp. LH-20]
MGAPSVADDPGDGSDDWVVLTFRGTEEVDDQLMAALEQTEHEADEALQRAGVGAIDGNEIGDHEYQLYFVGKDRDEMWRILRPVVDRAPVAWERAELRHTLDDPQPWVVAHP